MSEATATTAPSRPREPRPAGEAVLEVQGLRKRWPDGRTVLDGVDLTIPRAGVFVLLGPNGSGKTTLLRCLNRLEDYQEGRVLLRGELVGRGRPAGHAAGRDEQAALTRLRQRVGMVFQQLHLFPHVDVLANVTMGPLHVLRKPRAQAEAIALDALRKVGLEAQAGRRPAELSGGQQQRVAIARALAMSPELLLFDEPTSALDPQLVREAATLIRRLVRDGGTTMLLVTHDLDFAGEVADHVLFMDAGRIVLSGAPDQVFASDDPRLRGFTRR